jgi:histidinol-phosphate aminotransferase
LRDLDWVVTPSQANFILCKPPPWTMAAEVAAHLRAERILVRHFDTSGLQDRLRISIGDGAAVDRILTAVASMQPR